MNAEQVDEFEQNKAQLSGLYTEMTILSKGKPNDAINKFKLRFINSVLAKSNEVLGKYRPFADFEKFDADELPTNSDVVVILSQYLESLEKLKGDNTALYFSQWYWNINGERSNVRTSSPKNSK